MPRRGYTARGGERGVSIPVFLDGHGGAVAFVATWRAASRSRNRAAIHGGAPHRGSRLASRFMVARLAVVKARIAIGTLLRDPPGVALFIILLNWQMIGFLIFLYFSVITICLGSGHPARKGWAVWP